VGKKQYCLCCGEDVETDTVYHDGSQEIACLYCGFVLGPADGDGPASAKCILTADDSSVIRNLMTRILQERGLAEEVLAFENGLALLTEFNRRMPDEASVSLVILDLQMPVMDGIRAALTLRALEKKNNFSGATQIIFFSGRKCDPALKKQMARCTPAVYFNKGETPDPASLADRVDRLVSYILSQQKKA
jgi:CheY-like chemotaxis protein